MRGLCKVGLALGLAAFVVGTAMAQRGPGGGFGPAFLLMNKGVQEEGLKLDKDQIDKINEALKDDFAKLRDRDLPREERAEIMKKVEQKSTKLVADVLKPDQRKRLNQIQRQQAGLAAFADPEVQKALDLKDKQKEELKSIAESEQKERRDIFQNAAGDFQAAREKIMTLRKEKMDAAMKVLTDEQKKTYKELLGAPFEVRFGPPR
jgi:hypothetical protein